MTIKYWTNFSKRKNSTKQPTSGTDLVVKLKDACSIINPVIESATLPVNANYIYIDTFKRYYFVTNVVYISNTVKQFSLEVDVLASYKSNIGSTVAHILYASTNYDTWKNDTRLPTKNINSSDHVAAASGLSSTGCYILSLITDMANGKTGAIGHYLMEEAYLKNLVANLYDVSIGSVIAEAFYSPMDMIANCIWIPVSYASAAANCSDSDYITLNTSPINTSGRPVLGCQITNPIITFSTVSLAIPARENDFRDAQPYTSASLYLPGIGLTDLNINDFIAGTNVNIYTRVDITNGDIIYWIYDDHGEVLKTVSFNGAEQIPIAHTAANSKGAISGIGGAAAMLGAAALGSGTPASLLAAGSLMSAGNTALSFNQRSVSMKGGYSGRSSFADVAYSLTVVKVDTEDPDAANYKAINGRPVGRTQAISNHSGYVQCADASIASAGTSIEKQRVNEYLNTGFFYE